MGAHSLWLDDRGGNFQPRPASGDGRAGTQRYGHGGSGFSCVLAADIKPF